MRWTGWAILLVALGAAPTLAQEPTAPGAAGEAPPPGGIVPPQRVYGLGLGVAALRWDEVAPFDDAVLAALSIDRELWRFVRGRAGMAVGSTTLTAVAPEGVDVYVFSFDLQVLVEADLGPFRETGVIPYALGGFGSLVTNPSGDAAGDLPTRSQSMWTYGGGVRAGLASRIEARVEGAVQGVRLANPTVPEDRETNTIHNSRWEGSLHWLF